MLALLNMVLGILLAIGGIQELVIRGVLNGEGQPFGMGLLGAVTGLLLVVSGVALVREWPQRRTWVSLAALLNLPFVVYGALPPHRNVGILVLLVGGGYSLFLLVRFRPPFRRERPAPQGG
ncbi:MAG TPA: hypothetical protein VHG28_13975 [Longimicrobiaceae bacterium]|nr:hypothetical protein [Longimicrobiaceae bacterium]